MFGVALYWKVWILRIKWVIAVTFVADTAFLRMSYFFLLVLAHSSIMAQNVYHSTLTIPQL